MTDWYKIKRVLTWVNWEEKQIYPASRLPSAYQEVGYIQSSWTQRIDTWITPNDSYYWFEAKLNVTQTSWDWCLMDMSNWSWTDNARFWVQLYISANLFQAWWIRYQQWLNAEWYSIKWIDRVIRYNYNFDKEVYIDGNKATLYDVWNVRTLNDWSATYSRNWNIFCQTTTTQYTRFWSFKLYYMKIYLRTNLVRDFVPCYRKSDSVIWLYDLVNNQFYTNAGSWTFTKWPNV